jgi:hypothetical protein
MVATILDNDNIPDQRAAFGQELAKAEKADAFDPAENDNEPIFNFRYVSVEDVVAPYKRAEFGRPDNDNLVEFKVA